MKNHYQTLGLEEGASREDIQAAYDRLSKELNPSDNDHQDFFVEEYDKVQQAYRALNQSSILKAPNFYEADNNSDKSQKISSSKSRGGSINISITHEKFEELKERSQHDNKLSSAPNTGMSGIGSTNKTQDLKPNGQRAKYAIMLIWILLLLEIILLISNYLQYDFLQIVAIGGDFSMEYAELIDSRARAITNVYLIAWVVSAVTFIQWFRRAYFNLHLKVSHLSQTEGWAAGSWFVPIINLYRPYQIMKELYMETNELLIKNKFSVSGGLTTNVLGSWWTLWIISTFLGQIIIQSKGESIEEMITSTGLIMILNVLKIPLALIAVKIVKDYSKVEPFLNEIKN